MKKIILPYYYTDDDIREFAAKYFAPGGIPEGVKFERAPRPEGADDELPQHRR